MGELYLLGTVGSTLRLTLTAMFTATVVNANSGSHCFIAGIARAVPSNYSIVAALMKTYITAALAAG